MSDTSIPVNTKYYLNNLESLNTLTKNAKKKYPDWEKNWSRYKKLIKCIPPTHIPRNDIMSQT